MNSLSNRGSIFSNFTGFSSTTSTGFHLLLSLISFIISKCHAWLQALWFDLKICSLEEISISSYCWVPPSVASIFFSSLNCLLMGFFFQDLGSLQFPLIVSCNGTKIMSLAFLQQIVITIDLSHPLFLCHLSLILCFVSYKVYKIFTWIVSYTNLVIYLFLQSYLHIAYLM